MESEYVLANLVRSSAELLPNRSRNKLEHSDRIELFNRVNQDVLYSLFFKSWFRFLSQILASASKSSQRVSFARLNRATLM
jgi:hypothetical protein